MSLKVLNPASEMHLNQISQQMPTKFAYAKWNKETNEVQRLHSWVLCRDYLGDVIWSNATKKVGSIYGFCADYNSIPLNEDELQMLISFPKTKVKDTFLNNYKHILGDMEAGNNLTSTEVHVIDETTVLLTSDKFWQSAVFLISLYTYLLRVACYQFTDITKWQTELLTKDTNESMYCHTTSHVWDVFKHQLHVIRAASKTVSGYEPNQEEITRVHNHSGFVSVLGKWELYANHGNAFAKQMQLLTV